MNTGQEAFEASSKVDRLCDSLLEIHSRLTNHGNRVRLSCLVPSSGVASRKGSEVIGPFFLSLAPGAGHRLLEATAWLV